MFSWMEMIESDAPISVFACFTEGEAGCNRNLYRKKYQFAEEDSLAAGLNRGDYNWLVV
jgi:hypothetical protein